MPQTRIETHVVPHTKSAVNPNMYKYQDFVRTRQQLQFEENTNTATKGSDSKLKFKASLPFAELRTSTAEHLGGGGANGVNPSQIHQPLFIEQPSHLHQHHINEQRVLSSKPHISSGSQHQKHSLLQNNKYYSSASQGGSAGGQHHQHNNSKVRSPKLGSQNVRQNKKHMVGPTTRDKMYDVPHHQSLDHKLAQEQFQGSSAIIAQQAFSTNVTLAGAEISANSQQQQDPHSRPQIMSRSHLTSATQCAAAINNKNPGKKQKQQDNINFDNKSGAMGVDIDFKKWQVMNKVMIEKDNSGGGVVGNLRSNQNNNHYSIMMDSGQPSIVTNDSQSKALGIENNKLPAQGSIGNQQRMHQHPGRIVKLPHQAAFNSKDPSQQQQVVAPSTFAVKAQSPKSHNNHHSYHQHHQKASAIPTTDIIVAQQSIGMGPTLHHQGHHNHHQHQHLLNGNLSKIKNQFVQKSGHLMASSYHGAGKDMDLQQQNRQANGNSAYQSEAFPINGGKHRDMSNYSNNSQYTHQQIVANTIGGQLKQNNSGGLMSQQQQQQQTQQQQNAGIPIFIQRNQQWHQGITGHALSANPMSQNATNGNINNGTGSTSQGGMTNGNTIAVAGSEYHNNSIASGQSHIKSGQSCILPQIQPQKEQLYNQASPGNLSVLEANRPAPIQAQHYNNQQKKMNVEQHARDFPEYFNIQSDQSATVPAIGSEASVSQQNRAAGGGISQSSGVVSSNSNSGKKGAAVSASANFKKSSDSNNYQHNELHGVQSKQPKNNRSNSGRKLVQQATGAGVANSSGNQNSTWQTASTSRKQKSSKITSAMESGNCSFMLNHPVARGHLDPMDQSGAYELSAMAPQKKNSNGIYQMAIKSAAATVGVVNRTDPNSLSIIKKGEAMNMHNTGEMKQTNAVTMQSNREPLSISNNLQRSMNFRRRQSKEMRSNSAKWNNISATAAVAAGTGKNYGTTTISHKSPHQIKPSQKHQSNTEETFDNRNKIQYQQSFNTELGASTEKNQTRQNGTFTRKKQAVTLEQQNFKLKLENQQQVNKDEENIDNRHDATNSNTESKKDRQINHDINDDSLKKTQQDSHKKAPVLQTVPLHVGFQFSYDLGDEPDEDDDEMNNTDGDEEGEEEQDDILIVEGDDEGIDDEDEESQQHNIRGKSAKNFRINNCSSTGKDYEMTGIDLTPANKSLNVSQEEVSTQLYGGDIYLLGGNHFFMKDQEEKKEEDDQDLMATGNKFSQASTTAGSEVPGKSGSLNRQISQLKKRSSGRSRKRTNTKATSKQLQKIQERDSLQEAGEEESSVQPSPIDNGASSAEPGSAASQLKSTSMKKLQTGQQSQAIMHASMTDKQRKHAVRDEFLKRPPNQIVTMIKSPFPTREPYIFFPYPPFLGSQRNLPNDYSRIVQCTQEQLKPYCTPGFKVSDSTHTYNCVVNALKMAGFRHVTGPAWNVIWTGLFRQGRLRNMNQQQHINHFAGSWAIGRKDYMWRNVQRMRRLHGKSFDIAPSTYIFPEDYKRWMIDRESSGFKNMYIMKPNAASCGKGIRVIGKKQTVQKRNGYIVSKYVSKPHLIRGYKYDLRLYVLVTSFDPVKIYMFRDGLVRLATVPYSTSKSSLKQRFVHLTNYSVNKKADAYVKNTNSPSKVKTDNNDGEGAAEKQEEETVESKLSLQQLRKEYQKMGVDYNEVFAGIKDVIVKTCFSAEQPILQCMGGNKNKNSCFEIYGFDVIIDAKLRPWLLEVNVSPSLSSSSPLDKQIKTMLLSDTLYLIGFRLMDRKQQELEKAKQNKQRLLGFDSQKKKQDNLNALAAQSEQVIKSLAEDASPLINSSKEPKSGVGRSRQPTNSNNAMTPFVKGNGFNSFISNDSHNPDLASAGLPSSHHQALVQGNNSSAQKSSSPNRKRTALAKIQPPRPWLKDLGEPVLAKGSAGSASLSTIWPTGYMEGFVNLTDNDLEMLADYEEEQQRKGHFEVLFPTAKNIDNYRGFLSSNRRANLVLWAYLKQGAPMHQLINHFKYMQLQNQLLQQQASASASANM